MAGPVGMGISGIGQMLVEGVRVVTRPLGSARVAIAELDEAVHALRSLPPADLRQLARNDIAIELIPAAAIDDGLLGATTIVMDSRLGRWRPTLIRVATKEPVPGNTIAHTVRHEVGHALAVLQRQDRSEHAADIYAAIASLSAV